MAFFSSFQYVTLISGQLLALCVLIIYTLTEGQLSEWGWRIPFAIGALLAIVVFWIRRGLVETQSSKEVQEQAKMVDLNQVHWLYLPNIQNKPLR